jgi:hypothetical protein
MTYGEQIGSVIVKWTSSCWLERLYIGGLCDWLSRDNKQVLNFLKKGNILQDLKVHRRTERPLLETWANLITRDEEKTIHKQQDVNSWSHSWAEQTLAEGRATKGSANIKSRENAETQNSQGRTSKVWNRSHYHNNRKTELKKTLRQIVNLTRSNAHGGLYRNGTCGKIDYWKWQEAWRVVTLAQIERKKVVEVEENIQDVIRDRVVLEKMMKQEKHERHWGFQNTVIKTSLYRTRLKHRMIYLIRVTIAAEASKQTAVQKEMKRK